MNSDLQERVIVAINTLIEQMIEEYIDDHQAAIKNAEKNSERPVDVLNLIITLKHWANPNSSYQPRLHADEYMNFQYLMEILEQPKKILNQEKKFTHEDEVQISLMVQAKLTAIADQLMKKYALEAAEDLRTDKDHMVQWWNNQTKTDQEKIKAQFANMTLDEKRQLFKIVQEKQSMVMVDDTNLNLFWYFWMIHYCSQSRYQYYDHSKVINSNNGHSSSINNGDVKASRDAADASGVLGFSAGILIVFGMMFAGAVLGSIVPGIGTLIGCVLGGLMGIGPGTLIAEYTVKGLAYLRRSHDSHSILPKENALSKNQKKKLLQKGFNVDVIERMIMAIDYEKCQITTRYAFFSRTEARAKKYTLNRLLDAIKNYPESLNYPVKIGRLEYDPLFSDSSSSLRTRSISSTAQFLSPILNEHARLISEQPVAPVPRTPSLQLSIANVQDNENEVGASKFSRTAMR